MELSQSQQGAAAPAEEPGQPRKLARARMPSPPCARNIFTDGPEEEPDQATRLTRRPPYVSRYRCAVLSSASVIAGRPLPSRKAVRSSLPSCPVEEFV